MLRKRSLLLFEHSSCSKVLVVDDAPDVRRFIRGVLSQYGIAVIEACNGEEAWTAFIQEKPQVIILDL